MYIHVYDKHDLEGTIHKTPKYIIVLDVWDVIFDVYLTQWQYTHNQTYVVLEIKHVVLEVYTLSKYVVCK